MDRLEVIDREAARLADVLAGADPSAPVPTCPGWTAADLLWHLTDVHLGWAAVLAQDPQDEAAHEAIEAAKPARPATVAEMLPIRAAATADLLAQLRSLDDAVRRWSWWDADQTVGFTRRMQTYEATMHRVDAELTAGLEVTSIETDVAAGAVDHAVDVMWGWMPEWGAYAPLAVVELRSTQGEADGGRWTVEIGHWTGTGPESGNAFDEMRAVRATGGEPAAVVEGQVEHLARWAWGRAPEGVTVTGADEAVAVVDRLLAQGMQ